MSLLITVPLFCPSNAIDTSRPQITVKGFPNWALYRRTQISAGDIGKTRSAYDCANKNTTNSCFLHISEPQGIISSTNSTYYGCKVAVSSTNDYLQLWARKFRVIGIFFLLFHQYRGFLRYQKRVKSGT